MKFSVCMIAAAAIAGTWTVMAQPPGGRGGQGGPGGHQGGPPPSPVVEALDVNQDHEISAREIAGASASLKKLDRNRDGKLTHDEIHSGGGPGDRSQGGPGGGRGEGGRGQGGHGEGGPRGGNGGPGGEHGHGQPTPEQFLEHAMTFDADKDGMISKAELAKMAKAVTEEMAKRGGGGPGGGGPGGHGGGGPGGDRGPGGRQGGEGGQARQRPPIE